MILDIMKKLRLLSYATLFMFAFSFPLISAHEYHVEEEVNEEQVKQEKIHSHHHNHYHFW